MQAGDVMKLGRMKYKVKQMCDGAKPVIDFHPVQQDICDLDSDYSICDIHSTRQLSVRDDVE